MFAMMNTKNYSNVLRNLDIGLCGLNYRILKKILIKFELEPSWREDNLCKLQEGIRTSYSMTELLEKLSLSQSPTNFKRYKEKISLLNLDTSHWGYKKHSERHNCIPRTKKSMDYYLVKGSKISSSRLRKKLIEENILKEECHWNDCPTRQMKTWRNKHLPYELDHINGISNDNRLKNLRILCRICHAHTPTHSKRKIT